MITITFTGNLGADAELKMTQGGQAVCSIRVAAKDRKGVTEWFRCALWGKRGESIAQYLRKGTLVTVVGELAFGEYNGKPQYDVDIAAIHFSNPDRERGQQQPSQRQAPPQRQGNGRRQAEPPPQDDFDYSGRDPNSDIPF